MRKRGWYPDPRNANSLRWWDGASWSLDSIPNPSGPAQKAKQAYQLAWLSVILLAVVILGSLIAGFFLSNRTGAHFWTSAYIMYTTGSAMLVPLFFLPTASAVMSLKLNRFKTLSEPLEALVKLVIFLGVVSILNTINWVAVEHYILTFFQ